MHLFYMRGNSKLITWYLGVHNKCCLTGWSVKENFVNVPLNKDEGLSVGEQFAVRKMNAAILKYFNFKRIIVIKNSQVCL